MLSKSVHIFKFLAHFTRFPARNVAPIYISKHSTIFIKKKLKEMNFMLTLRISISNYLFPQKRESKLCFSLSIIHCHVSTKETSPKVTGSKVL